jgi:hypothetical protein
MIATDKRHSYFGGSDTPPIAFGADFSKRVQPT